MTDVPMGCLIAFCAGAFVGIVNYSVLWATVRRLVVSQQPVVVGAASFVVRMVMAVAVIAVGSGGSPLLVAASLSGLVGIRHVFIKRLGPAHGLRRVREGNGEPWN